MTALMAFFDNVDDIQKLHDGTYTVKHKPAMPLLIGDEITLLVNGQNVKAVVSEITRHDLFLWPIEIKATSINGIIYSI